MFCPQCSQQQASDEMLFCSRCGFPLQGVAELVSSGGQLDATDGEASPLPLSPRQRGVRQGAVVMIAAFAFGMLAMMLTLFKEDLFVFLPVASLFLVGGLLRMLYALLLEDRAVPVTAPTRGGKAPASAQRRASIARSARSGGAATTAPALPPLRSTPARDFTRQPRTDTAEMSQPPSVTENATRLLDDE